MDLILAVVTMVILGTILMGIHYEKKGMKDDPKRMKKVLLLNVVSVFGLLLFAIVPNAISAASTAAAPSATNGMAYLGAALSTGLSCIGSGIAVGQAGSAAIGAISEDSSIMGKMMIILGLAEGVAIYGLVISILILVSK